MTDTRIVTIACSATEDPIGHEHMRRLRQAIRQLDMRHGGNDMRLRLIGGDEANAMMNDGKPVCIVIGIFGWKDGNARGFASSEPARLLERAATTSALCVPVFYEGDTAEARAFITEDGWRSRERYRTTLLTNSRWRMRECDRGTYSAQWERILVEIIGEFLATHPEPRPAPEPQPNPTPAPKPRPVPKPAPAPAPKPAPIPIPEPQPTPRPFKGAFWSEDPNFIQQQKQNHGQGASEPDRNVDRQRQSSGWRTDRAKDTGTKVQHIRGNAYFYMNVAKGVNSVPGYIHTDKRVSDTIINKVPNPNSGEFVAQAHVDDESLAWLQRRLIMGTDAASTLESAWRSSWAVNGGTSIPRCVFQAGKGRVAFPIDPANMRDSNVVFTILRKGGQEEPWIFDRFETAGMFQTPSSQLNGFALMRMRIDNRKPIQEDTGRNGKIFLRNVRNDRESYAKLAEFADPERWDDGKDSYGILRGYLSLTLCRCKEQNKVLINREPGKEFAVFNTGLMRDGRPIYAGFKHVGERDKAVTQEWILCDFFTESGGAFALDAKLARKTQEVFGCYPAAADYPLPILNYDTALDPNRVINLNHILFEHLERVPVEFLRDVLPANRKAEADTLKTKEGRDAFKQAHEQDDMFLGAVNRAFDGYYRRDLMQARNGRSLLNSYNPREMRYDDNAGTCVGPNAVLMPIWFGDYKNDGSDRARALIIVQDGTKTDIRTVLTLPFAYNNARTSQSLANVAWLSPDRVFGTEH